MDSSVNRPNAKAQTSDPLRVLAEALHDHTRALERIASVLEDFASAYLAAKFPFGDHQTSDRWRRRR